MTVDKIIGEVQTLSGSALARLAGSAKYADIDNYVAAFAGWAADNGRSWPDWQTATAAFALRKTIDLEVSRVGERHFDFPLYTRGSDRTDFHDVSCEAIQKALVDAVLVGYTLGTKEG